jgi:hypothetical protein
MRRKIYFVIPLFVIGAFLLAAFGDGGANTDYPSGAPAGNTGSPGDGQNCTFCHNGSASTQAGIITSDIPAQGYTPGSSYTITVTLSGSGQKGFEVSPQNASGTLLGTLTAGSGNKLVGAGKYCTHSSAVGGSSATWNFTWTAPAAGTGQVTFYGAFCISKPVTKLSTLVVDENTAAPLSVLATATPSSICSGNSSQLNAIASGGTLSYIYSWTSLPVGFTSSIQNPVVTPAITTQYIVHVDDGSQTITDTTQVDVIVSPTAAAGPDTNYCVTVTEIPLHGIATGYTTLAWTTNGDGTFSSTSNLNSIYYPGSGDKNNGSVHLTLTASPQAPCTNAASSTRVILFDPCGVGMPLLTGNPFMFSLRPNPSNGIVTIYSSNVKNEDILIRVTDLSGKVVLTENLTITGDKLDHRMDLSSLTKGIYFIRIETKSTVKTGKLILQ